MIDAQRVAAWLGGDEAGGAIDPTDARLVAVVSAVVAFIDDQVPSAPRHVDQDTGESVWSNQTDLGATMLAARLWRRRNSPAGIESFTDTGAAYVTRHDQDVALLLRMGASRVPRIG